MNERRLRDLYQAAIEARTDAGRADCVSPEDVMALVDRQGAEEDRMAVLDHVMSCDACRRDFELLRAVRGSERTESRASSWRRPLLAAAALVLLLGTGIVWRAMTPGGEPTFRGGGDEIALLRPSRSADGSSILLAWRPVPRALSYRVELLDSTGAVVFGGSASDTTLALPPSLDLAAGMSYRWWVQASVSDGTVRTGGPVELPLPVP